MVVEIIPDKV